MMIFHKGKKQTSNRLQFRYLSKPNLRKVHMNYIEQFLLGGRMSLSCLNKVRITCEKNPRISS